jgi:hypothetical protein
MEERRVIGRKTSRRLRELFVVILLLQVIAAVQAQVSSDASSTGSTAVLPELDETNDSTLFDETAGTDTAEAGNSASRGGGDGFVMVVDKRSMTTCFQSLLQYDSDNNERLSYSEFGKAITTMIQYIYGNDTGSSNSADATCSGATLFNSGAMDSTFNQLSCLCWQSPGATAEYSCCPADTTERAFVVPGVSKYDESICSVIIQKLDSYCLSIAPSNATTVSTNQTVSNATGSSNEERGDGQQSTNATGASENDEGENVGRGDQPPPPLSWHDGSSPDDNGMAKFVVPVAIAGTLFLIWLGVMLGRLQQRRKISNNLEYTCDGQRNASAINGKLSKGIDDFCGGIQQQYSTAAAIDNGDLEYVVVETERTNDEGDVILPI